MANDSINLNIEMGGNAKQYLEIVSEETFELANTYAGANRNRLKAKFSISDAGRCISEAMERQPSRMQNGAECM